MCNLIVYYPVFDIMNFEIYLSFLITLFPYMTKRLEQKLNYVKNEKSFKDEIKTLSIIFKGLSLRAIKPTFWKGEIPTLGGLLFLFLKVGPVNTVYPSFIQISIRLKT